MTDDPFAPISGPNTAPGRRGSRPTGRIVIPVPPEAPKAPRQHPKLGTPRAAWTYRDQTGDLLGYVFRFEDKDGAKSFRPLCLYEQESQLVWRWQAWPAPRPLYGLDRLAAHAEAPVIITEGEKAADAAQRLLPGSVLVTSPNGSKSADKADWTSLKDRTVIIWPDADDAGRSYAETVATLAMDAGTKSVSVAEPPSDVAAGWDAADAEADGYSQARALELIRTAKPFVKPGRADGETTSRTNSKTNQKPKQPPKRDALLAALEDADLWHSPEKIPYATFTVRGHLENWRIESAAFQRWAAGRFYRATGGVPASQMLADTLRVLCVRALEDGPCHRTFLRTGWDGSACWLDLGDPDWRAVRITAYGWQVVNHPPVKFIRSDTMTALPEPEAGHLIEEFRGFVNADEDDYRLIVAWLVAALWGRARTYPVLALGGEQGSGKSTMARLLRTLVDPSAVSALALPKDERDLFVQAMSGHVLSFDNVSKVEAWFSDAVCRLATGSGFLTRKLHSDAEPFWFQGSRPVLLNGIPSLTDRADLAERALTVRLKRIDEASRQSEDDFWADWERVLPGLLGALLDALSSAVRRYDQTRLDRAPRMADFARLMAACEPGLGWETGDFMDAYTANRRATTEGAFEADPVAVAILKFVSDEHPTSGWEGTATELLGHLNRVVPEDLRRSRFWPAKPNALGNAVDRAAPLLRHKGIHVTKRNTGSQRLIILTSG